MDNTIVFDLDGVIAFGTVEEVYSDEAGWAYEKCLPIQHVIDAVVSLKKKGFKIAIHTARWDSDLAVTEAWLKKFGVPYDILQLGKPRGKIYVDDLSFEKPFNPDEWTTKSFIEQIRFQLG